MYSKTSLDVQRMFGAIAKRYDFANSVLSGGVHYLWRRLLYREVGEGGLVLDLCTGTGGLIAGLQKRARSVIGVDFCRPMLVAGKTQNKIEVDLIQGDALHLPFADQVFDAVTIAFGVRNFENTLAGLIEVRRVLKDNSALIVLEFGQPSNVLFGILYRWYSKNIMPLLGKLISGDGAAYSYLPSTAAQFPCGESFIALANEAGFKSKKMQVLTWGIAYLYTLEGN